MSYARQAPRTRPSAFTLVELLIVVLILAVLAAVAMPMLDSPVDDSKVAALDANLALLRGAIERYKAEHRRFPGKLTSQGATCPNGGSAGTGLVNSAQALADQLTMYTDANGRACTTRDATFRYGPYLRSTSIPANPVTGSSAVEISTNKSLDIVSTRSDLQGGWLYKVWTGKLVANDASLDER